MKKEREKKREKKGKKRGGGRGSAGWPIKEDLMKRDEETRGRGREVRYRIAPRPIQPTNRLTNQVRKSSILLLTYVLACLPR